MTDGFQAHADAVASYMESLGAACPKLSWAGQSIRCVPSGARSSSGNSPGGFALGEGCAVQALAGDFDKGVLPENTQNVTYPEGDTGRQYRIAATRLETGGKLVRLELESASEAL
jgi:hypothetical protein